jgi:hypothetical protein
VAEQLDDLAQRAVDDRFSRNRVTTVVSTSARATEKKSSPIPTQRCTNITKIITTSPSP